MLRKLIQIQVIFLLVMALSNVRPASAQCTLDLGNDTVLCIGSFIADAGSGFHSYEWSTGSTDQSITISSTGIYILTVTEVGTNIVVNGDFELGNIGFTSNYTYNSSSLWLEGTFWVGNNANAVHPNFVGWDHTPAPGVNFLICNGSATWGDVVWEQVVNVTPGIDYIFSTWICSVVASNPAVLAFYINNIQVGAVINAPNSTSLWVQFYELWNSGLNTTVTISIINQAVAASGNDFGLDDIYFAPVIPCVDSLVVNPPTMTATSTQVDIACKGESTGEIDLIINNGYSLYSYSWTNGAVSQDQYNLPAGTYAVTVTDAANCTAETSITLTEPNEFIQTNFLASEINCAGDNNGSIDLTVFGGTAPYTYAWSNGSQLQDLNNLSGALYTVTITDAGGCEESIFIDVFEPDELEVILIGNNLSCNGDTDGSVQIFVSGGIADYLYQWSNGQSTAGIHNLPAGTYYVTVQDLNNCISSETISITEPPPINLYSSQDATICLGQETDIVTNAFGGTPPYDYFWNPGGFGTAVAVVDPEITTEYCVYISDDNHCASNEICVTITVNPALDLELEMSDDSICAGDTILLESFASGGNGGPYLFELGTGEIINDYQFLTPEFSGKIIVVAYDGCGTPAMRDTLDVVVSEAPTASFQVDKLEGCPPLEVQFLNNFPDSTSKYFWDFDDSQYHNNSIEEHPIHLFRNPGIYDITFDVTNKFGCTAQHVMDNLIHVFDDPIASFTVDEQTASMANPVFNFYNTSTGASDYFWQFGHGNDADSVYVEHPSEQYFPDVGEFLVSLIAENIYGCRDTAFMLVDVESIQTVYYPNAIYPYAINPDNKLFRPIGISLDTENYFLAVYSRWGQVIFETTNFEEAWDGRNKNNQLVPPGTYVWILQYEDVKGNRMQDTGNINVLY